MKKIKITAVLLCVLMLCGVFLSSVFAINASGDVLGALGEYFGISGNKGTNNSGNLDDNDNVTNSNGQVNLDSGLANIGSGIAGAIAGGVGELYSSISGITDGADFSSILSGGMDTINELVGGILTGSTPTTNSDGSSNQGGNSSSSTPSNTIPQYTNIYNVTEAPQVTYNYSYNNSGSSGGSSSYTGSVPSTTAFAETTTAPGETTTFAYVPPSQIYADQYTTALYNYDVADADANAAEDDGVTLKMILGIVILVISGVAVVGVALSFKKSKV